MCDSGCVCPYICVYARLCICCCCLSPHTTTVLESASATHSLMYVCVCVYVWCLDVAATVDDRTSWSFSAGSFLQLPAHTHTHKFIHTHKHKYTQIHAHTSALGYLTLLARFISSCVSVLSYVQHFRSGSDITLRVPLS